MDLDLGHVNGFATVWKELWQRRLGNLTERATEPDLEA
jgi:hypothetical protein